MVGHFLFDQSMLTAGYMLATVLLLLVALATMQQPAGSRLSRKHLYRLSAVMLLQAVPVMLILFILFPRIPGPLWGLPADSHRGLTGLSDSMSPGSISELIQSDEVAFRVRFDGTPPPVAQMYWRGPVLWWYRNQTWKGLEESLQRQLPYTVEGDPVSYTVTLEPHGKHWLFALDVPGTLPSGSGVTSSYQLKQPRRVNERTQYRVSFLSGLSQSAGKRAGTAPLSAGTAA